MSKDTSSLPTNRPSLCCAALLLFTATCAHAYAFQASGLAGQSPLFRHSPANKIHRNSQIEKPLHIVPGIQRSRLAFALRSTPNDSSGSGSENTGDEGSSGGGQDQNQNSAPVPAPAPSISLLERMDEVGQNLKPLAVRAKDASVAAADVHKSKAFLYTIKSCVLFGLFIAYRAYRGLFVLLPAVFQETYSKLESSSVLAPFVDEDELDDASRDTNPETGKLRFRTRATVAVLSMMVTLSYVVSGAWRVLTMLFKTLLAKGSMKNSFEAAADEILENEEKIKKITKQDDDEKSGRVNGSDGKLDGSGM